MKQPLITLVRISAYAALAIAATLIELSFVTQPPGLFHAVA